MNDRTDLELVTLYLSGNERAFEGLIHKYSKSIFRLMYKLTQSESEAHDITQETFIKAWKNMRKFDIRKNFTTWIFTIARRTLIDSTRRRKYVPLSSLDTDEETSFEHNIPDTELLPHEVFERSEMIDQLRIALQQLPLEAQTILLLHHGEDMTFESISEIVGKPMNTTKSIYRRSLLRLRHLLTAPNTSFHT